MNNKKSSKLERIVKFMGSKGFYIVLILCVAVIGVSIWVLSYTVKNTGLGIDESLGIKITANLPSAVVPEVQTANPNEITPPTIAAPNPESNETINELDDITEPEDQPVDAPLTGSEDSEAVMSESEPDLAPTSFVWPVSGNIETPYAMEALVYDRTMMDWRTHKGIDIESEMGAKVFAIATGTVEKVYDDQMMGTTVILYHGGGLRSIYNNLASTPAVSEGALVEMGDIVGAVGDTAIAEAGTVTHLHFEMSLNDEPADPLNYLPAR
ncbi:MAG: M23 family metallopeptidase [Clostridiales bacterium]|nr:M23 family metallopeptidase [Clostridiales bacterium]